MNKIILILLGMVAISLVVACAPKVEEKVQLQDEEGNFIGEAFKVKAGDYKVTKLAVKPIKQLGITLKPGSFETLSDGSIKVSAKSVTGPLGISAAAMTTAAECKNRCCDADCTPDGCITVCYCCD